MTEHELERIVAEQARDDTSYVDPQKFDGVRTVSFDKFIDVGRDFAGNAEPVRASTDRSARKVGGVAPPKAPWTTNRVHPIIRPRGLERTALTNAVKPFLDDLVIPQAQTVQLVVFGQLSQRAAGHVLGISQPGVFKRLRAAYDVLRERLEAASGSAGQDFPATRPFDETDRCRLHPRDDRASWCGGHFAPGACDEPGCGTVLPVHYNSHTSCRLHSSGRMTRYTYNLAWLVQVGMKAFGRAHAAGRHVRSAPARSTSATEAL